MGTLKNVSGTDRLRRIIFSLLLFVIGYFWVGSTVQLVLFILSGILLITAITGYCGLYTLFWIKTYKPGKKVSKLCWSIFTIIFLLISIAGSYYSIFFTKKFFLEDYNIMNNYYKQTLFNTGKDKRAESITNYNALVAEYKVFLNKYTQYHPYVLRFDKNFNRDLLGISVLINSLKEKVNTGDLPEAHLDFEKIRPIFQDILKRNNLSLLAVSLVDFHDVMETVIVAADKKDTKGVLSAYIDADAKLQAVEEVANDSEIQDIRRNLDAVKTLAEENTMETISDKAAELKSSFIKVYLKRG